MALEEKVPLTEQWLLEDVEFSDEELATPKPTQRVKFLIGACITSLLVFFLYTKTPRMAPLSLINQHAN